LALTQAGERACNIAGRIAKDQPWQRFGSSSQAVFSAAYCIAAIWLEFELILGRIDG